jgi:chemotaxis protein methyltransferase CheR
MRREDRDLAARLCAARAGIMVDPEKAYFIETRLAPVARREGFGSIEDMMEALRERREDRMAWAVVEALAQGETAFFRDRAPFDLFRDEVLPNLATARDGRPVRIWSAACGSGQEAYSLAMVIENERGRLPGLTVELFASDIGERQLEKAQSGLFTQFEVQRGLPIRQLVAHFEQQDDMWQAAPRLRQMIRWRRVNLVAELETAERFDVIFCRYVLSALVDPMKGRLLANLARALSPEGYLFLGEQETAAGLCDALRPVSGCPGLYARSTAARAAA